MACMVRDLVCFHGFSIVKSFAFLQDLSFKTTHATWQFGLKMHFTDIWSHKGLWDCDLYSSIVLDMLATFPYVLKHLVSSFCLCPPVS